MSSFITTHPPCIGKEPQLLTFIWTHVNPLAFRHSHIKLFPSHKFSRMWNFFEMGHVRQIKIRHVVIYNYTPSMYGKTP